jgi:hypothetical protein
MYQKEREHELALMMLHQLYYIIRCVNLAAYYGSKTSMIASYLIEYIMPHYSDELSDYELCDFEPFEIDEIINSFKDADIQLKMMQSAVNSINVTLEEFDDSIDDLMAYMNIFVDKTKCMDGTQLDYEKYYTQKRGDLDEI